MTNPELTSEELMKEPTISRRGFFRVMGSALAGEIGKPPDRRGWVYATATAEQQLREMDPNTKRREAAATQEAIMQEQKQDAEATATARARIDSGQRSMPGSENTYSTGAECARTPGAILIISGVFAAERWLRERKN